MSNCGSSLDPSQLIVPPMTKRKSANTKKYKKNKIPQVKVGIKTTEMSNGRIAAKGWCNLNTFLSFLWGLGDIGFVARYKDAPDQPYAMLPRIHFYLHPSATCDPEPSMQKDPEKLDDIKEVIFNLPLYRTTYEEEESPMGGLKEVTKVLALVHPKSTPIYLIREILNPRCSILTKLSYIEWNMPASTSSRVNITLKK